MSFGILMSRKLSENTEKAGADGTVEEILFLSGGDGMLTVQFPGGMCEETNRRIHSLALCIEKAKIRGIRESVPTFSSLSVYYDPLRLSSQKLKRHLQRFLRSEHAQKTGKSRVFEIPVCYEGEYAPDLDDVCALTGLSHEEVIRLHSGRDYRIYMLGFLPGFPYLGGMDERIEAPRLATPRTRIPAGAVGIGGKQTGIYPLASPGGWRLIGRTPVKLYDPERELPILYRAGDAIRFIPITEAEFLTIAEDQNYTVNVREEAECR